MNRIIVLGSSGFLGKSLLQKLIEKNFDAKYMIHKTKKKLQNDEFLGNILDKKCLLKILKDNDIVINLVGQYDNNLSRFVDINIQGGMNLIEAVKLKKNIKIIFASSINVYGDNCKHPSKETDIPNPMTTYGIIKFLTEQLYEKYSKLHGLDVTILRFSNLYGKNKKSGIISNIIKSKFDQPVTFTHNGNQQRDFLYIDDAISGIIKTIYEHSKKFEIFNISSGIKINPKNIIKLIEKFSKNKIYYNFVNKNFDEKCIWADNFKAKKILKFKPKITFQNGLNKILQS
jgi:UDP-glucose 4-epimerase